MEVIFDHYPFLKAIPEKDLALLDLRVIEIPKPTEQALLQQLAFKINKNILVYNKSRQAKGGHLCRYLKFARLTDRELSLIKECEQQFDTNQVVVAYEKPLAFFEDRA